MEKQIKKVQRVRSPNYPNYSLKECMTFLERLYKKYGTSEVHKEDAITQMGHSPTSSTANRVLASMLSFGLLESRGAMESKFVRLSKLAQEILLEDEGSPERYKLLQRAALIDDSMQEIWEKWGANIPHEDSIKKSLQLELGYTPEGAKRFAHIIAETYNFSKLNMASEEQEEEEVEEIKKMKDDDKRTEPTEKVLTGRTTNLLLQGAGRQVVISAPNDLTNSEFELALKWLEFQRYGLVNTSADKDKNNDKQEGQENN